MNLCSTRCEPVRWTSTSIPVYFCLKAWAIAVEEGSASEVYQTTDPSFLAACNTAASCAAAAQTQIQPTASSVKNSFVFMFFSSLGCHCAVSYWRVLPFSIA
jgi:succinate dehydrogenase/fumarate reductase-like Fe-S protein